jgi:hypothetical protein
MESEIWKDIMGMEGLYQISNLGRVKVLPMIIKFSNRICRRKEKILKTWIKEYGYVCVKIGCNKKYKHYKIHQLIATAFIPNPENKPEVNHKNGISSDNRIENLEWCTHLENMQHASRFGLMKSGEFNHNSKLKKADISIIRSTYKKGEITHKELAKKFNISPSQITDIINHKAWNHV